jgi:GT2 family glycosyltransferase
VSDQISVIVPSWRRSEALARCLAALARQRLAPLETLVVLRDEDAAGHAVARAAAGPVRVVPVAGGGHVGALNAGRAAARGALIAITDDDCEPHADWLERIAARFASDSRIGAVGGRDLVHHGGQVEDGVAARVGRVLWWGRRVGNHHHRSTLQDVHFLKGANMAYRAQALEAFDVRLHGAGAQVANDMGASLAVGAAGWRIVWDPAVLVDHHPAERFDEDGRARRTLAAELAAEHNELYVLLRHGPRRRRATVLVYRVVVGTREAPGVALGLVRREPRRAVAFARARGAALRTLRASRREAH